MTPRDEALVQLETRSALRLRARLVADALAPVPSLEVGASLRDAVVGLRAVQWSGTSPEGLAACPSCGRTEAYGHHCRSCPIGLALRRWAVCEEVWIAC